ncbi:MAG: hypothetical protein QOE06_3244 [Thermoleophilaceae bacterium]|nr:hypothetical protein [Thermoleophilaceae bacterium]
MPSDRTTSFSTAAATMPRRSRADLGLGVLTRSPGITRRHLQIALGLLWLLDGVLQAQPFMFTRGFATQAIAGVAQGQPGFVSDPVHWVSTAIAAHPVAWNLSFAGIQLLLGVGLLVPRAARVALGASIVWALGVWYLGEGLSGLASGHASLITGAPGSALLYAILAAAAWPRGDSSRAVSAPWLPYAWSVVWLGAAVFQAMPGQAPDLGPVPVVLLVAVEYLIGVGALWRRTRPPAAVLGLVLALVFWVFGQDLGMLGSGQATDPNSGPALALMAIALLAGSGPRMRPSG